jgi:glycosyltransferase involved in cell wall biosynthesis
MIDVIRSQKIISIVAPIFCEEKNIFNLYERLERITGTLSNYQWEYIFVNDGSVDNSYEELKKLVQLNKKVKVLNLTRNFGKEIALSAGVEAASGCAVITLDADLQHPPELIPNMIKKWEEGIEIVSTIRKKNKKQPLVRTVGSSLFYWIMKQISDIEVISQTTDFRLIDRKVADVFKKITEKSRMYRGIIDWMGFKKEYIPFDADSRIEGKPVYSYRKLLTLALNSITSFSLFPLKIAGFLGLFITIMSGLLLCIMLPTRFIFGSSFFSPLFILGTANTFLVGLVLVCLGIIALYIGGIHSEVINRPLYIVKDKLNFD